MCFVVVRVEFIRKGQTPYLTLLFTFRSPSTWIVWGLIVQHVAQNQAASFLMAIGRSNLAEGRWSMEKSKSAYCGANARTDDTRIHFSPRETYLWRWDSLHNIKVTPWQVLWRKWLYHRKGHPSSSWGRNTCFDPTFNTTSPTLLCCFKLVSRAHFSSKTLRGATSHILTKPSIQYQRRMPKCAPGKLHV